MLDFPASRIGENKFLLVKPSIYSISLWSPERTNTGPQDQYLGPQAHEGHGYTGVEGTCITVAERLQKSPSLLSLGLQTLDNVLSQKRIQGSQNPGKRTQRKFSEGRIKMNMKKQRKRRLKKKKGQRILFPSFLGNGIFLQPTWITGPGVRSVAMALYHGALCNNQQNEPQVHVGMSMYPKPQLWVYKRTRMKG